MVVALLGVLLFPMNIVGPVQGERVISERVSFLAEDGVHLSGRLDRPESETLKIGIILVHGGFALFSIDQDGFFASIPKLLAANGYPVLSLNMRRSQWFATSTFEDSVKDIRAAIGFMKQRGFTSIFLGGHSNGASEATYYVAQTQDPAVIALGLYAPGLIWKVALADFLGQYEYAKITNKAKNLVVNGRGDEIVFSDRLCPDTHCFQHTLSAQTWLSWIGPDSNVDTSRWIRSVSLPILILRHREDGGWGILMDRWYYGNATASRKAELKFYTTPATGNPHLFAGLEDQVVRDTIDWLGNLPPPATTATTAIQQQSPAGPEPSAQETQATPPTTPTKPLGTSAITDYNELIIVAVFLAILGLLLYRWKVKKSKAS